MAKPDEQFTPAEIATWRADPSTSPRWQQPELAALVFCRSRRTLDRWRSVGYIRASRPAGGIVLIDRDSVIAFIERGVTHGASAA